MNYDAVQRASFQIRETLRDLTDEERRSAIRRAGLCCHCGGLDGVPRPENAMPCQCWNDE